MIKFEKLRSETPTCYCNEIFAKMEQRGQQRTNIAKRLGSKWKHITGKRKEVNKVKNEAMAKLKSAEDHRLQVEASLKHKEEMLRQELEKEKEKMRKVMEEEERKRASWRKHY